jgi:glycosyltransferase involved in cell wall biosynthesis
MVENSINFFTFFPKAKNIHLVKDVGMIGYILHKYFGYNSTIVCYKNDEYNYLENEVKGLKIEFLKKRTSIKILDSIVYFIHSAKNIDVLHLFHLACINYLYIYVYKLLNKNGKVYLKLDINSSVKNIAKSSIKFSIKKAIVNKCDLISIETIENYNFLKENWINDIKYIPNGFYDNNKRKTINYDQKENIILTVGRIGTEEKATEILLESFRLISDNINDWKLKIVGPIEETFTKYIDTFFHNNLELKNKIIFTGAIYDRDTLEEEYRKAKIFCLTSRWEGFPLVFLEAIKNGCYIISSNVDAAVDITKYECYGKIFPIDDAKALAEHFLDICKNEIIMKSVCQEIQDYAYERFYWPNICRDINNYLTERQA